MEYIRGRDSAHVRAYQIYLIELFQEFGANKTAAIAVAEDIIDLETDLSNVRINLQ